MDPKRLELSAFIGLLALIAILMFFVFLPYLNAVILAYVFAILFRPLYGWFTKATGGHAGMGAFLTVCIVLIAVLAPLTLLGFQIFEEAQKLYASATNGSLGAFGSAISEFVQSYLETDIPDLSASLAQYTKEILSWIFQNFGSVFSRVSGMFVMFFLSLFTLYYFLKDGEKFVRALAKLSPLSPEHTEGIFKAMETAASSIIKGSLAVGVLQGILAGIGFLIFGVPNPALWGSLTVFASLIPVLGTALVLVPAALYLFAAGNIGGGIGIVVWGVFIVGLVDNFVRPHIIKRGVRIHPLLVLLSVLGGIQLLGPAGFLVGPLALSFLFALLRIYPEFMQHTVGKRDA